MPPTNLPAIAVDDLRVERGGVEVLHGLGFDIPSGQIVGLLGPSGSGKSTLIRALVGVQQRVSGRCEVLGHPAGHPTLRCQVGYVTQATAVYVDLTVSENLRYFAAVVGASRDTVERVIDQVDLSQESDRLVRTLSGGQHHRVSLAVALLGSPALLVLDEPTVGLDPVLRGNLWLVLHDLATAGVTLLVSSHVMDEASNCDRLLLLRDGDLLADDTEAALLARTGTESIGDAFLELIEGTPVTGNARALTENGNTVSANDTGDVGASTGPEQTSARPAHGRIMMATAVRVLAQLRHDPRTIALLLAAPILLIGLLAWILHSTPKVFDQWGAILLGVFPLIVMFLVTSVATLRERTGGTLERLMTTPMSRLDFLGGYAVAFGLAATAQALVVSAVTFGLFGLSVAGPVPGVWAVAVLDALVGMSLGLFVSAFARTEFQAVQFFPALLLPQLLLCGLIGPRSALPAPLEAISAVLPLTYAVDAMQQLTDEASITSEIRRDLGLLAAFVVGLLVAGAATLQRRTP